MNMSVFCECESRMVPCMLAHTASHDALTLVQCDSKNNDLTRRQVTALAPIRCVSGTAMAVPLSASVVAVSTALMLVHLAMSTGVMV